MSDDMRIPDKEEEIYVLVKYWIENNTAEFKENGKKIYRENVLNRCRRYDFSPTEYLETKLKSLPSGQLFYLQVLQGILIAGLLAAIFLLGKIFLDNLYLWSPSLDYDGLIGSLKWVWTLPALAIIIIPAIVKNKRGSPILIDCLQRLFLIKQNTRECEIEMYYISKILQFRRSIKCPKCRVRIPQDSIFCPQCKEEIKSKRISRQEN